MDCRFQRKLTLQNAMFPFKLISSLWKSRKIIKKFKPDVVIGTGGFASGAVLKVANSFEYSNRDSRTKFLSWNYQ